MCGWCQSKSCLNIVNVEEIGNDEETDIQIENALEYFKNYELNLERETDVVECQNNFETYNYQLYIYLYHKAKKVNLMNRPLQEARKVNIVN